MKITILTENTAGNDLLAEHGLSYLIEFDGKQILFDTGHSDVFLRNAEKLNIDINNVELIVLSHGHWDHGDGLQLLENKTLITHPAAFLKRFGKKNHSPVGLKMSRSEVQERFNLLENKTPYKITDKLIYLGEIPRRNDFEALSTSFEDDKGNDDFVPDDSALVAEVDNQLVIITGCSHSGICNIIEYAKEVTGISEIKAVIGGFHLKEQDRQSFKTLEYFKKNNIKNAFPGHCTELPVLALFYETFKNPRLKTGMILQF